MYDYNTLCNNFLQYKKYLGYKYKTDTIIVNEIKNYLVKNKITKITKEVAENYARLNKNLNSNTIARNMSVFRELCAYLALQDVECYQIPSNLYPCKRYTFIPYIFSHQEIEAIYNNLNINDNSYHYSYYRKIAYPLIIKILYQTGARIGEILNLKIKDYNQEQGYFHLKDTKNNQERLIVLSDDLNELAKQFSIKFHTNLNGLFFEINEESIRKYFKSVLRKSNIKIKENTPRLHDLRHTFVVHNIEKAINENKDINNFLPILQVYLGHQSLTALSYYFKLTNNILNNINKISENNLGYLIPNMDGEEYE